MSLTSANAKPLIPILCHSTVVLLFLGHTISHKYDCYCAYCLLYAHPFF